MKKKSKSGFHYRDTKTGKFVSKIKWKRSKAHGGKRYKRTRQRKKLDAKKTIKVILDELKLRPGGPFEGENGLYTVEGKYSQPPESIVRITIEGEGGTKYIKKRVRYDYESELFDPDPEYPWETEGTT